MKKFNFFPVLLVALFMLCGFDSSAQTYKPVADAIVSVNGAVSGSQSSIDAQSSGDRITSTLSQSLALNHMKMQVGRALLEQFKSNVDVATALVAVTNQLAVNAQRASYKADAIAFYKNLLLI